MYLLDTNIVSMLDPSRHQYAPELIAWLERNGAGLYISVITITEMEAGIFKLRRDNKKRRADQITGLLASILADFADRVLPVDIETARAIARLAAASYQNQVALPDLIIAATAVRHSLTVLTRNMADFGRLDVAAIDPFVALPPEL